MDSTRSNEQSTERHPEVKFKTRLPRIAYGRRGYVAKNEDYRGAGADVGTIISFLQRQMQARHGTAPHGTAVFEEALIVDFRMIDGTY